MSNQGTLPAGFTLPGAEVGPCELCPATNVVGAWVGKGKPLRFWCECCREYAKAGVNVVLPAK